MSGFPAYWTRDRIIDTIRRFHAQHGRTPGWNEWEKASPWTPTSRTVSERFGSWNTAIVTAGFEPRAAHRAQDWPADKIIAALQQWSAERGMTPRRVEWLVATATTPSAATVGYRFGSWNAGIAAAGFVPRKQARTTRWTRDAVADALLDHVGRTGSWPGYNEWRSSGRGLRPNSATIVALFGSFAAAKLYAGWDPDAASRVIPASVCAGCGTEFGNVTLGCRSCHDRARKRVRRDPISSACRLAAVEPPLTSTAPARGGTLQPTEIRVADVPAEEEVAA